MSESGTETSQEQENKNVSELENSILKILEHRRTLSSSEISLIVALCGHTKEVLTKPSMPSSLPSLHSAETFLLCAEQAIKSDIVLSGATDNNVKEILQRVETIKKTVEDHLQSAKEKTEIVVNEEGSESKLDPLDNFLVLVKNSDDHIADFDALEKENMLTEELLEETAVMSIWGADGLLPLFKKTLKISQNPEHIFGQGLIAVSAVGYPSDSVEHIFKENIVTSWGQGYAFNPIFKVHAFEEKFFKNIFVECLTENLLVALTQYTDGFSLLEKTYIQCVLDQKIRISNCLLSVVASAMHINHNQWKTQMHPLFPEYNVYSVWEMLLSIKGCATATVLQQWAALHSNKRIEEINGVSRLEWHFTQLYGSPETASLFGYTYKNIIENISNKYLKKKLLAYPNGSKYDSWFYSIYLYCKKITGSVEYKVSLVDECLRAPIDTLKNIALSYSSDKNDKNIFLEYIRSVSSNVNTNKQVALLNAIHSWSISFENGVSEWSKCVLDVLGLSNYLMSSLPQIVLGEHSKDVLLSLSTTDNVFLTHAWCALWEQPIAAEKHTFGPLTQQQQVLVDFVCNWTIEEKARQLLLFFNSSKHHESKNKKFAEIAFQTLSAQKVESLSDLDQYIKAFSVLIENDLSFEQMELHSSLSKKLCLEEVASDYHETVKEWTKIVSASTYSPLHRVARASDALNGLNMLCENFPHFEKVIEDIRSDLILATRGGDRFYLPAMLMDGPPGTGKTFFFTELARISHNDFKIFNMESISAPSTFVGLDRMWGNTAPGEVFTQMMLRDSFINPIFMLDEIDKLMKGNDYPVEPALLSLLEPHSAARFKDRCFPLQLDLSAITWVATSNNIDKISAPIRSRFRLFDVPSPNLFARVKMSRVIETSLRTKNFWGASFQPTPEETLQELCRPSGSARDLRKNLMHGFAHAAQKRRSVMLPEDLPVINEPMRKAWDSPIDFRAVQNGDKQ